MVRHCDVAGAKPVHALTQPRTARQRLQVRHQLRVVVADEWNEAAIEMVRHCDVAGAKPEHALCLINRAS